MSHWATTTKFSVSQSDVQRSAEFMAANYRKHAANECEKVIQKMCDRHDPVGAEIWKRILKAVCAMEQPKAVLDASSARPEMRAP